MTSPNKTPTVDFKFEIAVIPVSDVDRAKDFYAKLGWRLDADFAGPDDYRVIQFTPPGSPASVIFGKNVTAAAPGSAQGLYLVVSDIEAARKNLLDRGVKVSEPFHAAGDVHVGTDEPFLFGRVRTGGLHPERGSYRSYASFSDPDGNGWLLQEVTARAPGRVEAERDDLCLADRPRRRAAPCVSRAWRAREAQRRPARCELAGLVRRIHRQGTGRRAAAAVRQRRHQQGAGHTRPRRPPTNPWSQHEQSSDEDRASRRNSSCWSMQPSWRLKRRRPSRRESSAPTCSGRISASPGREAIQVRVDIAAGRRLPKTFASRRRDHLCPRRHV